LEKKEKEMWLGREIEAWTTLSEVVAKAKNRPGLRGSKSRSIVFFPAVNFNPPNEMKRLKGK